MKIDKGEDIEKLNKWSNEVEAKLERADAKVERLQQLISDKERSEKIVAQEERLNLELKLHERNLKCGMNLLCLKPNRKLRNLLAPKQQNYPNLLFQSLLVHLWTGQGFGDNLRKLLIRV